MVKRVLNLILAGTLVLSLSACGNTKLTNKNINDFVTTKEKCDANGEYISKVYVTVNGNSNYKFENANVVVKIEYGVYHSFQQTIQLDSTGYGEFSKELNSSERKDSSHSFFAGKPYYEVRIIDASGEVTKR